MTGVYRAIGVLGCALLLGSCASDPQTSSVTAPVASVPTEWTTSTDVAEPPSSQGATTSTIPHDAIVVSPGDSLADLVASSPEQATFVLEPGVHRMQTVDPSRGQRFLGMEGSIMSGAMLLTDFQAQDGLWVHRGITAEGEQRGTCVNEQSTCRLPEDLYVDGERLTRVGTMDAVDEDSWYLDYATDTVYLGRDPADREVELAVLPYAFGGKATDVVIDRLIIEKYASPAQRGAIMAATGWTITNNELRWNHGGALYVGSELYVADNYIHHNGQVGIAEGGVFSVYERNEVAFNHLGDFSFQWGAGGMKFVHTTGMVLKENYVHDNAGPGIWIDGFNEDTTFVGNRVIDNLDSGIKIEISGSAIVKDNYLVGNAWGNPDRWRGAGIMIRESGPVEVVGNRLVGNREALILYHDADRNNPTDDYLHDIWVHDNEIVLDGLIGFFGDIDPDADLRFEDNLYLGSEDDEFFLFDGAVVDFAEWQRRGQDAGAELRPPS